MTDGAARRRGNLGAEQFGKMASVGMREAMGKIASLLDGGVVA